MGRLRIDARLYPVDPPLSAALRASRMFFEDGMLDCSADADDAARRLARAERFESLAFNEMLNAASAAYGVHITNIPRTSYEFAVQYGGDRTDPVSLLRRAQDLRDNVTPAVMAVYRPDDASVGRILGDLFADTPRCVVAV